MCLQINNLNKANNKDKTRIILKKLLIFSILRNFLISVLERGK